MHAGSDRGVHTTSGPIQYRKKYNVSVVVKFSRGTKAGASYGGGGSGVELAIESEACERRTGVTKSKLVHERANKRSDVQYTEKIVGLNAYLPFNQGCTSSVRELLIVKQKHLYIA